MSSYPGDERYAMEQPSRATPASEPLGLKCDRCTAANGGIFTVHMAGDKCPRAQPPSDAASLREALMALPRFNCTANYIDDFSEAKRLSVTKSPTGDWVRFTDVERLLAQRDARTAPQAQAGSEEPTTP